VAQVYPREAIEIHDEDSSKGIVRMTFIPPGSDSHQGANSAKAWTIDFDNSASNLGNFAGNPTTIALRGVNHSAIKGSSA
jgi:hypothetical protein